MMQMSSVIFTIHYIVIVLGISARGTLLSGSANIARVRNYSWGGTGGIKKSIGKSFLGGITVGGAWVEGHRRRTRGDTAICT